MTGEHLSCELPATARSVTEARRFVTAALTGWGRGELADTAALLTSEVVTNAVLHARTTVDLVIRQLRDGITVEVSDGSPVGTGRQAFLKDPAGNTVELHQAGVLAG